MNFVGVVEGFDDQRGDGTVVSDEGEHVYFHCMSIADGSRTIDAGLRVQGERRGGHQGHDEIVAITSFSSSVSEKGEATRR